MPLLRYKVVYISQTHAVIARTQEKNHLRARRGHSAVTQFGPRSIAVNRGQNAVTMFLDVSSMHAILREEEKTIGVNKWIF